MEVKTYTASATRSGKYWAVHVPGVGWTQARHLREVETMARDLIALTLEIDPTSFDIRQDIQLPGNARSHLAEGDRLRREARQANAGAAREVREAARILADDGLPLRDIGIVLGVSYQRASQLLA